MLPSLLLVALSTLLSVVLGIKVIQKKALNPDLDFLVLDLDDTLYRRASKLGDSLLGAIKQFVHEKVESIQNLDQAGRLMSDYYNRHGLTLVGLIKEDGVKPDDYEQYLAERIDYSLIKDDGSLKALLSSANANIAIFTNSGPIHTQDALRALGIMDLVAIIFHADYDTLPIIVKPQLEAYEFVQQTLQCDPHRIHFADDNLNNVRAAMLSFGWNTVHLKEPTGDDQVVPQPILKSDGTNEYLTISDIHQLPMVFPRLFGQVGAPAVDAQ